MITMSGSEYEKKCAKVADAYASIREAHEEFVNFLVGCGDIDIMDEELFEQSQKVGRLMDQAEKSLEIF